MEATVNSMSVKYKAVIRETRCNDAVYLSCLQSATHLRCECLHLFGAGQRLRRFGHHLPQRLSQHSHSATLLRSAAADLCDRACTAGSASGVWSLLSTACFWCLRSGKHIVAPLLNQNNTTPNPIIYPSQLQPPDAPSTEIFSCQPIAQPHLLH